MSTASQLSKDELSRYMRHTILEGVGHEGQIKLKNASVLCVGAGGLASSALLYLAAAGVGRIGIVDSDTVDVSNLQRQILFGADDIGSLKTEAAQKRLLDLNPHIKVEIYSEKFDSSNAEKLVALYDAVLDASDNFSTRYLINAVCVKTGKPDFFGSVQQFAGQVAVFDSEHGCYRCLFAAPPQNELAPDCNAIGVLGVLPGLIGQYQALEFLKWKLNIGSSLFGKILTIDTLSNHFRKLDFAKNPSCPTCSQPQAINLNEPAFIATTESKLAAVTISVRELQSLMITSQINLIDVREEHEYADDHIGGQLMPLKNLTELARDLTSLQKKLGALDQPVYVYCRSGQRSAQAALVLRKAGYQQVFSLEGGLLEWRRQKPSERKV